MRKEVLRELPKFVAEIQKLSTDYVEKSSPSLNALAREKGFKHGYYEISLDRITGRTKYARIVKTTRPGTSRSVHCFVNLENGDILKAASWKAPARHARGNIFDSDRLKAVGAYGANYLRANNNLNTGNPMSLRKELIKLAHSNPEFRADLLPLIKSAMEHDSPEALKQYLKDHPNADKKNHTVKKQEKSEKSKGKMSVKEWTSKVEKTKERISKNEKVIDDLKGEIEEQQTKTDEAKEKYMDARDEYWDMQNVEWDVYGKIENSDEAEKLKKMVEDLGGMYDSDASVDWQSVRSYAATAGDSNPKKDADKVKEALDEYLNSKFVKDQYARFDYEETEAKRSEVEELQEVSDDMDYKLNYLNEGLESMTKELDKQKKELSELESNKPEKEQGGGKKKEKKELTKAEMKKKYEESIKNSDMPADEKKKALERAKDPNFDVEGALAGMGDDEEDDGGKKASLKSQIVRVAFANPTLRNRLLPLVSGDKATPNLKSSLVRMAYENPELREHILPLINK